MAAAAETVRRAEAYLAAGADCIFPFAVTDADTIGRLTQAIQAPINIVGRAGTPDVATLERLGCRRGARAQRRPGRTCFATRQTGQQKSRRSNGSAHDGPRNHHETAPDAAREAAVPIVINARIDIYLKQIGDPESRFDGSSPANGQIPRNRSAIT
jgi:hypothetical protein